MAENRKDKENGLYYVNKLQLIMVASGFAATCAIVFLLGILVGQGIEERKSLKQEEPLVKVPLQPLPPGAKAGTGAPDKDALTFYDTLTKAPAAAPPPAKEPVKETKAAEKTAKLDVQPDKEPVKEAKTAEKPPKPAAQETKEAKAEAKESHEAKPAAKEIKTAKASVPAEAPTQKTKEAKAEAKESSEAKPAKETKTAKTSVAAEAPAQTTKESAETSATPENGTNGKPEAAPAPTPKIAQEAPKAVQETPKAVQETPKAAQETPKAVREAPKTPQPEKAKPDSAARAWTIQVNAFPEEARAQKLVERLKEKGYDAYVAAANVKGKDWYRVRVGRFATRAQAKGLLEDIQTKENFPKAIVVSR